MRQWSADDHDDRGGGRLASEARWLVRMLRFDMYPEPIPTLAQEQAEALIFLLRAFVLAEAHRHARESDPAATRKKRPLSNA